MQKADAPRTHAKKLPRICILFYLLFAIAAIVYVAFTKSTAFADWWGGTIGSVGRRIFAYLLAWLPFSFAELLVLLLIPMAFLLISIGIRHYCASTRSMFVYIGILLSVVSLIGTTFVFNFAPGYYGTPLEDKLGLERRASSAEELYLTAEILSDEIRAVKDEIIFLEDGTSLMPYSYEKMNEKLLEAYDKFTEKYDCVDHFFSRVKPIMLSEPMSYTHITGVYTFFTGEANINVNFPDYTVPFTAAHELAHQRGIAREDEANFIAFLVCKESDDPYLRYSAYLNAYEYVAIALSSADYSLYCKSYADLPIEIQREELAYAEFFEKYRENVAADVSDSFNDSYLQSQGSAAGSRTYNLVVDLAVAYYRSSHP